MSGRLRRGGPKKGLQESLQAEIAAEIEALVGHEAVEALDLEAIEQAARRQSLALAARAIERLLNADRSDHGGATLRCACGGTARYAGRRPRLVKTVLGEMTLWRAYYHCGSCREGFCPRDEALGLVGSSLSPALTRMVGVVGAVVSFREGSELLRELAGVEVEPKQVERTAEALGAEIAEDERRVVEPAPAAEIAPTMYLGMDGTGVPMRACELEGRAGKQADGTAKTREVKLCTVWTAESRDKDGNPIRDEGSVSYSAGIESAAERDTDKAPSEFAARVLREATRRGFDRAARRAVLGDGAPWIWNLADVHLPGGLQIVDLFHAKENLSKVAKSIWGPTSEQSHRWAEQRHIELDAGELEGLLEALARQAERSREAANCFDYVTRNRHRMRYPEFRAAGLCVSSGVVEAGCKITVGARLKRAGMHWSVRGANAIASLRCSKLSGRFESFWERRAGPRKAA